MTYKIYIMYRHFVIRLQSKRLIRDIPMNTFRKSRYAFGDKLELISKGHRPPPRGFLAVNARKLAMIATRLSQTGDYTDIEEERESRMEMEMVKPCLKFGLLANARPVPESIDQAVRTQVRTAKALRDVSIYGDSSIWSGKNFLIGL